MSFEWKFEWEEPEEKVIGLKGTLMIYLWNKDRNIWTGSYEFDIDFIFLEKSISHSFELEPIYEKKVFLVVEERKIEIDIKVPCRHCDLSFSNMSNMNKHSIRVHGIKCEHCPELLFFSHREYHDHMSVQHRLVGQRQKFVIQKEEGSSVNAQKMSFEWKFKWEEPEENVIGLKGTLMIYLWNKDRYNWTGPYEFDIELIFLEKSISLRKGLEMNMDQCYSTDGQFWLKHSFELEPIYEKKVFLIVEEGRSRLTRKSSRKTQRILPIC
ncbi:unnamed protein product [Caenorhabditis nigoni]